MKINTRLQLEVRRMVSVCSGTVKTEHPQRYGVEGAEPGTSHYSCLFVFLQRGTESTTTTRLRAACDTRGAETNGVSFSA